MELICTKYNEKMLQAEAVCRHPTEYCKFRTSCMIVFVEQERRPTKQAHGVKNTTGSVMELRFDKLSGLIPAIVQDFQTNEVLMLAYINEQAWKQTLSTGKAHYWSRSRNKLWLKGETSGHVQLIKEILVDCDEDTVIYKVEQLGGAACHKGFGSCFFRKVSGAQLLIKDKPVFDPGEVYKK